MAKAMSGWRINIGKGAVGGSFTHIYRRRTLDPSSDFNPLSALAELLSAIALGCAQAGRINGAGT